MDRIDLVVQSDNTLEEDEHCILMTVYDLLTDVRDQLVRIHGRSPDTISSLISVIRDEMFRDEYDNKRD